MDRRLIIVFLIMFTEIIGFSMVLPVIPFLALELGLTPLVIGLIMSVFSICQLFASPITGKLSDRFGRRPLFIVSQASTFIGFFLLGIAINPLLIILSRLIDGLFGSNWTVSQAYISDITDPKDRTRIFGYSSAVFGAGLIFGPSIGGFLATISYSLPMFFAAGITLFTMVLIIFFLPETVMDKPSGFTLTANDIFPIQEAKRYRKDPLIRGLVSVYFVFNFGFMLFITNFALFMQIQFGANALNVGIYQSSIGIVRVIFQSLFIAALLRKLGENRMLAIGIATLLVAMIGFALTTNYLIGFIWIFLISIGTGVCRPLLTSKLVNTVPKKESGSLLGVNNSLVSIGQITAPIMGGIILEFLPPFLIPSISALMFIIMLILWRKTSKIPQKDYSMHIPQAASISSSEENQTKEKPLA